jgi:RNA polymerase sigma-70 factor (ECF subfamily)
VRTLDAMLEPRGAEPPVYDDLPDNALLDRIREGDLRLFDIFARRNARRLYRAARAILRDDAEAERVVRDTFLRVRACPTELHGRARLSTWLLSLAVREARARARARGEPRADRPDAPDLERAIDALPDGLRAVFVLRALDELSISETAEVLCVSTDAVRERFARAVSLLRPAVGRASEVPFALPVARRERVVGAALRPMPRRSDAAEVSAETRARRP